MKVYVARQPIFTRSRSVLGYELLYREEPSTNRFQFTVDGSKATRTVISDAITTFGLNNLTNGKFAFINFTKPLLTSTFPYLLDPEDFVIEILEDVSVDEELCQAARKLQEKGYLLALDDYTGGDKFRDVYPYVDIIKVDFSLVDREERLRAAQMFARSGKRLLAEKVETEEDFRLALDAGYSLFQGYYFSKPIVFTKSTADIASGTYMKLMRELTKPAPNFDKLAEIIRMDITLSYKFLYRINTLEYYRSHRVRSIKHALIRMGLREVRRWTTFVLLRDSVGQQADELVKTALIRGVFAERVAEQLEMEDSEDDAFTIGMFSMIDAIMEDGLQEILAGICIPENVRRALLGESNAWGEILHFVKDYERGDWTSVDRFIRENNLEMDILSDHYLEAVSYADLAFDSTPGE